MSYCDRITYDNKINPVNKLNLAECLPIDGILGFPSYLAPGVSKNNIVAFERGSLNYEGKFTAQSTGTLAYTYNSAGLPETCVMKYQQDTDSIAYYYEEKP